MLPAYLQKRNAGPFPGRIDPWAEQGLYFHQIHGNLIGNLIRQLFEPLMERGYIMAREPSLQVIDSSQPDIAITHEKPASTPSWSYSDRARQFEVDAGMLTLPLEPPLDSISIRGSDEHRVVTLIEIISPSNKSNDELSELYLNRRRYKVRAEKINVVEIDLTRSVKRLFQDILIGNPAYNIALFMPEESRIISMDYGQPLKPFVLPLYRDGILVEVQSTYDEAYQMVNMGWQIETDKRYTTRHLPFPSTLTDQQRTDALAAVETWRTELAKLRE